MTRSEFDDLIAYERKNYLSLIGQSWSVRFMARLFNEPLMMILRWQMASRYCDYYYFLKKTPFNILCSQYYRYKRNRLAMKIGVDIATMGIGRGFLLYHSNGTVINGSCIIGENFHLHGNNCIGNGGVGKNVCPMIGNHVTLGVGAKVIGNVHLADGIVVGAGAVVVKSFEEKGITLVGVPAKKLY